MNTYLNDPDAQSDANPRDGRRSDMRRWFGGGIIVAAIVVALAAWWIVRQRPASTAARPAAGAAPADTGMAGMNMSSGGTVRFTAGQLRQFGVTFGDVAMRTLDQSVRTVGAVTVSETALSEVTARFGGYVERLYVDETGQQVHEGQPLMDIYSPELVAAQQELLIADKLQRGLGETRVAGVSAPATDLVATARRRFALWEVSDAQIDTILRRGQVQRTLTLYARRSGVVLEKHVVHGQAIQPGVTLYRIASLDTVWIDVALREQDAGAVRVGSRAAVALASYPGRPFTGRVGYVYPTLDQAARTVRARIVVPNPAGRLMPGMYATVTLATPIGRTLTVPTSAVLNTGTRSLVFMDMGDGALMPMDVVAGRTAGAYTEVISGIKAGQRVVTSAQYLLDSESNLAEVMKSMIGQTGTADMGNMKDMNSTKDAKDAPGMKGMKSPPDQR